MSWKMGNSWIGHNEETGRSVKKFRGLTAFVVDVRSESVEARIQRKILNSHPRVEVRVVIQ
ncbi:hypothetical protein BJ508DRAFT_416198 [Ascobolus immersus RN42]|uniref:Uncharacterized protein n=1 Tax=Ascobolus immersus RN42 TaxID=1160509 RepID=A0A3N4I474_ASCIM|nr:hypothetical protein BJ508DRAFT_416198 [Ascobolus immersus RN42]